MDEDWDAEEGDEASLAPSSIAPIPQAIQPVRAGAPTDAAPVPEPESPAAKTDALARPETGTVRTAQSSGPPSPHPEAVPRRASTAPKPDPDMITRLAAATPPPKIAGSRLPRLTPHSVPASGERPANSVPPPAVAAREETNPDSGPGNSQGSSPVRCSAPPSQGATPVRPDPEVIARLAASTPPPPQALTRGRPRASSEAPGGAQLRTADIASAPPEGGATRARRSSAPPPSGPTSASFYAAGGKLALRDEADFSDLDSLAASTVGVDPRRQQIARKVVLWVMGSMGALLLISAAVAAFRPNQVPSHSTPAAAGSARPALPAPWLRTACRIAANRAGNSLAPPSTLP